MITDTSDSHQIPSQKKTKWKLQPLKNCQKLKFPNFASNFTPDTPFKVAWFDKMYEYEMDSTRTAGATERTRDAGRTDGQTDGRMEWNQYTPQQLRCAGGIINQHRFE